MNTSVLTHQSLFGTFELDADGVVLYHRSLPSSDSEGAADSCFVGQNFLQDILTFDNSKDFSNRFNRFKRGNHSVENFTLTCPADGRQMRMKVMLVRISESSSDERTKLIIVDIRKTENP